jgi:hypothetical protein
MGDQSDSTIHTAIKNIMSNQTLMSKIFDSEAFKEDITKATENKTEFLDIFCSVFD